MKTVIPALGLALLALTTWFVCASPSDDLVLRPKQLDFAAKPLVNPMSGLFKWNRLEIAPLPTPSTEVYRRYSWRQLEPEEGRYDFSAIESELESCAQSHRRFAFRVMAVNGAWSDTGQDVPDYLVSVLAKGFRMPAKPTISGTKPGAAPADTYVPDWNDPIFLTRSAKLTAALGKKYDGDPRIAWVDIGTYGNWGEWHLFGFPYPTPAGAEPGTTETKKAIVDMYVKAFSRTRLIMMTDDEDSLIYAMSLSPQIGIRRDSFSSVWFEKGKSGLANHPRAFNAVRDRWKTAPVIAEFQYPGRISKEDTVDDAFRRAQDQIRTYHIALISNGNFPFWRQLTPEQRDLVMIIDKLSGYRLSVARVTLPARLVAGQQFTLRTEWANSGVTPAYDAWKVTFLLTPESGSLVWSHDSSVDLRSVLPTQEPLGVDDSFTLPSTVPPGRYTLQLLVNDRAKYLPPMELALRDREESGAYDIGQVVVAAP